MLRTPGAPYFLHCFLFPAPCPSPFQATLHAHIGAALHQQAAWAGAGGDSYLTLVGGVPSCHPGCEWATCLAHGIGAELLRWPLQASLCVAWVGRQGGLGRVSFLPALITLSMEP